MQLSVTEQNARLDAIATTVGASPTLTIFTGTAPANCATADSGTVLVTMTLPATWMNAASGGTKAMTGTWSASATNTGTAGYFRIKAGTTCHLQGTVGLTGGGADLQMATTSIVSGAVIAIGAFTLTDGNS